MIFSTFCYIQYQCLPSVTTKGISQTADVLNLSIKTNSEHHLLFRCVYYRKVVDERWRPSSIKSEHQTKQGVTFTDMLYLIKEHPFYYNQDLLASAHSSIKDIEQVYNNPYPNRYITIPTPIKITSNSKCNISYIKEMLQWIHVQKNLVIAKYLGPVDKFCYLWENKLFQTTLSIGILKF